MTCVQEDRAGASGAAVSVTGEGLNANCGGLPGSMSTAAGGARPADFAGMHVTPEAQSLYVATD